MSERTLEDALLDIENAITSSPNFVRAVFSGRRRNMETAHERIDFRPVELKDGIAIQVSYSDGRQMTSKNFTPAQLPVRELAQSGYANFLVEIEGETLSLRISKKGVPLLSK